MALFGDDDEQGAPKKGFFASIGSAIGSVVKFALVALAAIVTLGLVFQNDTAKNFVDGFTGGDGKGDGKGAASWVKNLFDKGIDKTKEFLGMKPSAPPLPEPVNALEAKEIGGKKVLVVNNALVETVSRAVEDVSKNKDDYRELQNLKETNKSLSQWNAMLTTDQKADKAKILNAKQDSLLNAGQYVESLNTAARAADPNDPARPPEIPLKMPNLPGELNDIGLTQYGAGNWNKFTPIMKLQALNTYFNDSVNAKKAPNFNKSSLDDGGIIDGMFLVDAKNNPAAQLSGSDLLAIPGAAGVAAATLGTPIAPVTAGLLTLPAISTGLRKFNDEYVEPALSNVYYEAKLKRTVEHHLSQGNPEQALAFSNEGLNYFAKEAEGINPVYNKEKFGRYTEVIKDFKDSNEYLKRAQQKQTLQDHMSEVNKGILGAVETAPMIIASHKQTIADLENGVATQPSPPAASPPQPSSSGEQNHTTDKEERARAAAASDRDKLLEATKITANQEEEGYKKNPSSKPRVIKEKNR